MIQRALQPRPHQPTTRDESRLDRYRLGGVVSEGGVGRIVSAQSRSDGHRVAIKMLHEHLAADERCRAQVRREAEALIVAASPGVCGLVEQGETASGDPFLVLEWLDGISLRSLFASEGPLTGARLRRVFAALLDALKTVHARGVVHCDLKPENVMVTPGAAGQERVRLIDFGVASIRSRHFAPPGQVFGTPGYVAPEVMRGATPTPQSDLYAVGVILYLLLTGRKPFETHDIPELIRLQTTGPAPRVAALNPTVPSGLEAVVAKALERRPQERYTDAKEFRAALVDALGDEEDTLREEAGWMAMTGRMASGTPPGGAQTISVCSGEILYLR